MTIFYECSFSRLTLEDKIKVKKRGVGYAIASTWLEVSRVLYKIFSHETNENVVLFISDELYLSCQFFDKISSYGVFCYRVNALLENEFNPKLFFNQKMSKKFTLNKNDIRFIEQYKKLTTIDEFSKELGVNMKKAYNQKSALLQRIGLPNDHKLLLLLPAIDLMIHRLEPNASNLFIEESKKC